MRINLQFTHAAKASAIAHSSVEGVSEKIRGELAELLADGLGCLSDLVFHTVDIDDDRCFICIPINNNTVRVDFTEWHEMDKKIDKGTFRGKKIMMPEFD